MADTVPLLQPIGPDIWLADGPTVQIAGFVFPTRMAVIRFGGKLFLWSPVALTPALRAAVAALGEVAWLVAPTPLHYLFFGEWQRAFPAARSFAAPGLPRRRPDLRFVDVLGDDAPADWRGEIDQVAFRGNLIATEWVFFHRRSATVLFTDLIQHFEPGWFSGWRALVARLDLMSAPAPEVPRKFRVTFVDRRAARAALGRILDWPIDTLVMAHGAPVHGTGKAAVVHAFRWLG